VEIVSDKTPDVYAALMRRHRLVPEHFLMVGNSMRSDILPVLALGGWAVYVPFTLTWAHEAGSAPTDSDGRYHEIEHLGQLPALIQRIE
jgi:putative hydrolase of the HAD superfamily